MLRHAARLGPIAVAAVPLTGGRNWNRENNRDLGSVVRLEVKSASRSSNDSVGETKIWKMVATASDVASKGLLGQTHWIYRLVNSEAIGNVYDLEQELGRGAFATVYVGRHKHVGFRRAVKKISKGVGSEDHDELMKEIYTLMDLDHPHIIKLYRTCDDGKHLYIVSELCKGPSLLERIVKGPMSEQEMGVTLRHIMKAVQGCHSHYMGHYDIKPENFMYSDVDCKRLVMIDLGLSSGFKRDPNEFKGTVIYMAPEVFFGMYGPEADMWSCGVVLFVMATRQSFFPTNASDEKVASHLQDRNWVKERLNWASQRVSPECYDLLSKMLCYDRHMRITAADALKHPFIESTYHKPKKRRDNKDEEAAIQVIKSMADSFVDFGSEPVLIRAGLLAMVHIAGYVNKEAKAHRQAYAMLDRVGSGELSIDSIEASMPKYGLVVPDNLGRGFQAVDLNRNGYITYGIFLSATLPLKLRCREDICRRAFELLDRNHDGVIDKADLAATFLSKEEAGNAALLHLCRDAIEEVSPGKSHIDFDCFFSLVLRGNSPITGDAAAT